MPAGEWERFLERFGREHRACLATGHVVDRLMDAMMGFAAGVMVAASPCTIFRRAFLPYSMAAAAGAMLYVVVEELIPATVRSGSPVVGTLGFIGGFTIMMALDNALG